MRNIVMFSALLLFAGICTSQTTSSKQGLEFAQALNLLGGLPADHCDSFSSESDRDDTYEIAAFEGVSKNVLAALNDTTNVDVLTRATEVLKHAEAQSDVVFAKWPDGAHLRGRVLWANRLLLLELILRGDSTYYAFASVQDKSLTQWREVGSDDERVGNIVPYRSVHLYPLYAGKSGRPLFLAATTINGCAGSSGIQYRIYQWTPGPNQFLDTVVTLDGAFGMDAGADGTGVTRKDPFHPVGMLRTSGTRISLPFCWFSGIDTWDNPSMCAVDTYDLRGEQPRFISRRYNRPDLLPVSKVLQYAGEHDLPAAAAYCTSTGVARQVARAPYSGGDLQVKRIDAKRERVILADQAVFTVTKIGSRWLVTAYSTK